MNYIKNNPELFRLLIATLCCYFFLEIQLDGSDFGEQGLLSGIDIIVISFLASSLIAVAAVIAGVGGGVRAGGA